MTIWEAIESGHSADLGYLLQERFGHIMQTWRVAQLLIDLNNERKAKEMTKPTIQERVIAEKDAAIAALVEALEYWMSDESDVRLEPKFFRIWSKHRELIAKYKGAKP